MTEPQDVASVSNEQKERKHFWRSPEFPLYAFVFMVVVNYNVVLWDLRLLQWSDSGCKQAEHLTASVCLACSSTRPLSALPLVNSTSPVPPWWYLTAGMLQRHKRGPLGFCRCTVPLENMTTDHHVNRQRGGMTDSKRQWEKRIRRRVWRSDNSPVIRHAPHNETLSKH